jgi:hypothetical protein
MSGPVFRRLLILSAVAVAALGRPARAQDSVAAQLKRFEDEWASATLHKDTVPVARILASTYVSAGPDGRLLDRAHQLEAIRTDTTHYLSAANTGYRVWAYGTTVVISGIFGFSARGARGTAQQRYRWIDTWVRQADGRWLCVASMGALLPQ